MTSLFGRPLRRDAGDPQPAPPQGEMPPRPQEPLLPRGAWRSEHGLDPEFDPCGAGPLAQRRTA